MCVCVCVCVCVCASYAKQTPLPTLCETNLCVAHYCPRYLLSVRNENLYLLFAEVLITIEWMTKYLVNASRCHSFHLSIFLFVIHELLRKDGMIGSPFFGCYLPINMLQNAEFLDKPAQVPTLYPLHSYAFFQQPRPS